jgi:peptidoglycan/xylan/chitin deacetylase (PgdA/CDA1 family)
MDAAHKPVSLTYHSISDGPSPLEIPPGIFAEQMEWLKANARVVPLGNVVSELKAQVPLPERTAVLTFDDGYLDFYEQAAPVLLRLKLPAIVFLPTMYVGATNRWPNSYSGEKKLMTWEQILELAEQGIEFGSHSHTHAVLTQLVEDAIPEEELSDSGIAIKSHIGSDVKHFCYPYGRWNRNVREVVAEFYESACSTGAGVIELDADPYALPRVDAHYVRNLDRFRTLFTEGFVRYVTMRRWVRRLRGQPEGHYARL